MRIRAGSLWAAMLVVATGRVASADHCHSPLPDASDQEPRGIGLRVWLSLEAATYDNPPYEGDYEGAALGVSFQHRPLQAWVILPSYRLLRSGQEFFGVGDLLTGVRLSVIEDEEQTRAAGFAVVATWPSGDRARDLGMGHVMLMPGIWGDWRGAKVFVRGELSYGRALAPASAHSAHQYGAPIARPLVSPMNGSEAAGRLAAGYLLHELFRVRSSIYGAIPIADEHGVARGIASAGADLIVGSFDAGLEGHVPFVGDPFEFKVSMTAGVRF